MKSLTSYSGNTIGYGGRGGRNMKLNWYFIVVVALNLSVWLGVFYALRSILT